MTEPAAGRCCPVVELRQYTLEPGRREDLIEVFDGHLVEPQEALGMTVIGQFRDLHRPDRFVWLRGFPGMDARHRSLETFYGGPVWAAHKNAANATMLAWDDVLLLKPARPDTAFRLSDGARRPAMVLAGIQALPAPRDDALVAALERRVGSVLREKGIHPEGLFVTETAPNTFERLPVREGENVLVWFGTVAGGALTEDTTGELAARTAHGDEPSEILLLEPTSRSLLGGGPLAARSSKHDFDFLFGSWNVRNRYLDGRLRGSTEWREYEARCEAGPLLHGLANMDRYTCERDGKPFEGMTLRLFDPVAAEWTIHWADSAHPGHLIPPMVGAFRGGAGEFFGDETVDGRAVRCRFLWMPDPPRWEQAFSDDGGETWETNWIMEFTHA